MSPAYLYININCATVGSAEWGKLIFHWNINKQMEFARGQLKLNKEFWVRLSYSPIYQIWVDKGQRDRKLSLRSL